MVSEEAREVTSEGVEGKQMSLNTTLTLSIDSIIIVVVFPDEAVAMIKAANKETVCKMNSDYSDGTIEYKSDAQITNGAGETRQAKMQFKLESKGGKFKLYAAEEDQPSDKVVIIIKEKKEVQPGQ